MNYCDFVLPSLVTQPVYEPGKPIEQTAREWGIAEESICKMASNETIYGVSPRVRKVFEQFFDQIHRYPDGGSSSLINTLSQFHALDQDQFIIGNGSNEIIELVAKAVVRPGVEVVMGADAFPVYFLITLLYGGLPVRIPMPNYRHDLEAMHKAINDQTRLVFIASPNNPTGRANPRQEIIEFIESLPSNVICCLDQAYTEYQNPEDQVDVVSLIQKGYKVMGFRTFSKIYGLAGLRIGYGFGQQEWIAILQRTRQPFNVNSLAQLAAEAALGDHDFVGKVRIENRKNLIKLQSLLQEAGFSLVESDANFVLVPISNARDGFEYLQKRGFIVRPITLKDGSTALRITVEKVDKMEKLVSTLTAWRSFSRT